MLNITLSPQPNVAINSISMNGTLSNAVTIGNDSISLKENADEIKLDYKLIGFHARVGRDYNGHVRKSIRSIAPIIDSSNCELATVNHDPATFEEIKMIFIEGTVM